MMENNEVLMENMRMPKRQIFKITHVKQPVLSKAEDKSDSYKNKNKENVNPNKQPLQFMYKGKKAHFDVLKVDKHANNSNR